MDLQDLLAAFGYGSGGLGTSDYSRAVETGQAGTTDPARAGLTPNLAPGGFGGPSVLATLSPHTQTDPDVLRSQ